MTRITGPDAPDSTTDPAAIEPVEAAPLAARAPVREDSPAFADFAVRPEIVSALNRVGITRTFAIQELTLPIALAGSDLIGQARTGTGKTLGFGVPLLNRLDLPGGKGATAQALVIAPTRELAVQVANDLSSAGADLGARVQCIYGGRAYEPQIAALRAGVDVVVGTPGRLLDLAEQGHLRLDGVRVLVLDEADEMLDLGFLPDIEKIMSRLPAQRQTMLFSATMPGPIVALARQFLKQPVQIRAEAGTDVSSTAHVEQFAYRAHNLDKPELLARVLQARGRGLTMIFTRTKRTAAQVAEALEDRGFSVAEVHGDLGQGAREQAMRAFRSGKVDVLVATDVAARGLDVDDVTHVINYQAPDDEKTYVHRIGRTARAGKKGVAVTFVDWDEVPRWKLICDALGLPFHEPEETYSTSEHLYLELDIPREATGVLPRGERTRAGLDAEAVEDLGETGRRESGRRNSGQGDSAHGDSRDGGSGRGGSGSRGGGRGPAHRTSGRRGPARQTDTADDVRSDGESTQDAAGPAERSGPPRQRRRTRRGQTTTAEAGSAATADTAQQV